MFGKSDPEMASLVESIQVDCKEIRYPKVSNPHGDTFSSIQRDLKKRLQILKIHYYLGAVQNSILLETAVCLRYLL